MELLAAVRVGKLGRELDDATMLRQSCGWCRWCSAEERERRRLQRYSFVICMFMLLPTCLDLAFGRDKPTLSLP